MASLFRLSLLIAAFLATTAMGGTTVWYAIDADRVAGVIERLSAGERVPLGEMQEVEHLADRWSSMPGVSGTARADRLAIDLLNVGRDLGSIRASLEGVLSLRPLFARGWLLLANTRLIEGSVMTDVVEAFDFSTWTAPREAEVVRARLELGVRIYGRLDDTRRRQVARDLEAVGPRLPSVDREAIRAEVRALPSHLRCDLRQRVEALGAGGERWTATYGL